MSELDAFRSLSSEQLSPGAVFAFVREGEEFVFAANGRRVDRNALARKNAQHLGPNYTARGLYNGDDGIFEVRADKIIIDQELSKADRFINAIADQEPEAYLHELRNERFNTAQHLADMFNREVVITIKDQTFRIRPHQKV